MTAGAFQDCTLAMIVGGRAVRLGGIVKGQLRLPGGPSIFTRTITLLAPQVDEIVLCGPAAVTADFRRVPDLIANRGAAAGVHAACAAARTTWVLALAGDLPSVSLEMLRLLWDRRAEADVVVAAGPGAGFEPLHAFYRAVSCAEAFGAELTAGECSFGQLYARVRTTVVSRADLAAVDPTLSSFDNVNTWEDVTRLGLQPPA